jgi:putative membrane protein
MILWLKAFHIIAMVSWFAGLFYLPRLFVYHATAEDEISLQRFKIMERRLYKGIMWPAAILTTLLGLWMVMTVPSYYLHQAWFHWKMLLVLGLWIYHGYCGYFVKLFAKGENRFSSGFFRFFNEIPTVILVIVVLLVVVKP